jgi:hypothetical protein
MLYDPASAFYFRLASWSLDVAIESDYWGAWDDFSKYDEKATVERWKTESFKRTR